MRRRAAWLVAVLLSSCTPHNDTVMVGNANGVVVSYVGDVADTLPPARQYCARYERVPVLHETKENNAYYFCVRPGEVPRVSS